MFITLVIFIICSYFIMPTITSAFCLAVILSIFFGRMKILTDLLIFIHAELVKINIKKDNGKES